jgi:glyoxylase-like metal-dependent hydrolase (beta-lactamase superfamily II)
MPSTIKLDVYVSLYKPISMLPSWDDAQPATWPANSVSLLSGEKEAVLIDALITYAEAQRVVEWIRATKKRLTTVYITHGHGDHFFGSDTILAAFPEAKAVALPEVVPFAPEQVSAGYMGLWDGFFPNRIPEHPCVPEPLQGGVILLEGHELRPIMVGQSDTTPSSVGHVPDPQTFAKAIVDVDALS